MTTNQLATRKPRLLDLYCKAGGAGMGYYRAGFEVVGVDIEPQTRYPFEFHQADALEYLAEHWQEFDAIHASPMCQAFSRQSNCLTENNHPDQIEATRKALQSTGKPYVIENVVGAPLINPILLCGTMFGLKVYRHRLFEVYPWMLMPPHIPHRDSTPQSGRGLASPKGFISIAGHFSNVDYARKAMGIDWMTRDELAQAIPPAYCEWIGKQLLAVIQQKELTQ